MATIFGHSNVGAALTPRPAVLRLVGYVALALAASTASAQTTTGTDGIMVLKNLTIPRGGVWLAGALGGHYWQPDQVLGICRVDPAPNNVPPFNASNCQGAAKSGGQAVAGNTPNTALNGSKYVYVPDASSQSINVVRYLFTSSTEGLSSPLAMAVQNPTSVGGGAGGGRPIAAALAPNGTDLYVGYLKSGDIMVIRNAMTATTSAPVVEKIGSTSDGRGVNAMVMFNGDLYLSELGGFGLSKITDPAGLTRAACSAANPCTAVSLNPQITFFPGGLATDGVFMYIGTAPVNGTPGNVLRWNPATGTVDVYSQNVPAYTATFDGKTRTQYAGPLGLGIAPNGDLYVGDDPTYSLIAAVLPTQQGHLWRVPGTPLPLSVTSVSPNSGPSTGNTTVTITGTGFAITANQMAVSFGGTAATGVTCATVTSCTAVSPAGFGTVDVRVTYLLTGQVSPITPADQFTFITPPPPGTGPTVTAVAPSAGMPAGGTSVTITGTNFVLGGTTVRFGVNLSTSVTCASTTSCVAVSPAGTGTVDVQVTTNNGTSSTSLADKFTYTAPVANLYAWGITAPKGGLVFVPGALGGHFWSSDHAAGFCRQDPVPGTKLHAINYGVCDDGTIGSPGQAVYDPRVNPSFINSSSGATVPAGTHFIYVPDNAVKSTAVWRLTFDPNTETIIGPPEAMVPLADVRTLKPNGMALGPDGNLYVTDLTEPNIRRLTGPNGDPRLQTITIVAVTGDGRGANGTIGFLGGALANRVFISENRAASWFDITQCPTAIGPCSTNPIPLPSGAFVAGVATDPVRNLVYASDSPGAANATIWRYDPSINTTVVYLTGGLLPAAGTPEATVWIGLTCVRPWDPTLLPGGIAPFSFAFGIWVDPTDGSLYITGDATAGARAGRGQAWKAVFVP